MKWRSRAEKSIYRAVNLFWLMQLSTRSRGGLENQFEANLQALINWVKNFEKCEKLIFFAEGRKRRSKNLESSPSSSAKLSSHLSSGQSPLWALLIRYSHSVKCYGNYLYLYLYEHHNAETLTRNAWQWRLVLRTRLVNSNKNWLALIAPRWLIPIWHLPA